MVQSYKSSPLMYIQNHRAHWKKTSFLQQGFVFNQPPPGPPPPGLVKEHAFWHFVPFPKQIKIIPYNVVTSIIINI